MTGADFIILSAQKPRHGEPCNGCGFCCHAEACFLSVQFLDSTAAPCIALEWDGQSKYRCGLITRPGHYLGTPPDDDVDTAFAGAFSRLLGAGTGCDASDSVKVVTL